MSKPVSFVCHRELTSVMCTRGVGRSPMVQVISTKLKDLMIEIGIKRVSRGRHMQYWLMRI